MTTNKQWTVYIDPADREALPFMVISEGAGERPPTKEECERACRILNEEGVTSVRISCRNQACKDVGGWIERARKDVEKNVYRCEVCGKAMER